MILRDFLFERERESGGKWEEKLRSRTDFGVCCGVELLRERSFQLEEKLVLVIWIGEKMGLMELWIDASLESSSPGALGSAMFR